MRRKIFHERGEPFIRIAHTLLQAVLFRRVVVECGRRSEVRDRADQQVAFRGMQVAARGITAQRPLGFARLLPRCDREGILEKVRDALQRDRRRRYAPIAIEILIGRPIRNLIRVPKSQLDQRRGLESPERIRLVRPIEVTQRPCIAIELVLGLLVIPHDLRERDVFRHLDMLLGFPHESS